MNYDKLILQLVETARLLSTAADALKRLNQQPQLPLKSRRGRKSMGAAERQVVSERMKNYWAGRRKAS